MTLWQYTYTDELYHYGVKGMRWGVRRFQNKDGSLTNAGKKRYDDSPEPKKPDASQTKSTNSNKDETSESKKRQLTDKQKKAIKTGAIVVGTMLAAYGAYKVHELYTGKNMKVDPNTGFRLLNKDMSAKQHLSTINPGRMKILSFGSGKNVEIINGSSSNCMLCTTAYEARKRGFDIRAGYSTTGFTPDGLFPKIYKNYKGTDKIPLAMKDSFHDSTKTLENITDYVKQQGNGARGNVMVWWKLGGGHSMIWENVNGNVKFMDGQTGVEYKDFRTILNHASKTSPVEMLRTDNLDFDYSNLKTYVNSDTRLKTYATHGKEIATKLAESPEAQIVGMLSLEAAGLTAYGYSVYKRERQQTQNGGQQNDKRK